MRQGSSSTTSRAANIVSYWTEAGLPLPPTPLAHPLARWVGTRRWVVGGGNRRAPTRVFLSPIACCDPDIRAHLDLTICHYEPTRTTTDPTRPVLTFSNTYIHIILCIHKRRIECDIEIFVRNRSDRCFQLVKIIHPPPPHPTVSLSPYGVFRC